LVCTSIRCQARFLSALSRPALGTEHPHADMRDLQHIGNCYIVGCPFAAHAKRKEAGGGQEQDERPYPQDYTLQECHVSSSCEIHKTCP